MNPSSMARWADIAAVAWVVVSAVRGYLRGFSGELAHLAGSVAGVCAGFAAYPFVAGWMQGNIETVGGVDAVGFASIAATVLIALVAVLLVQWLLKKLFEAAGAGSDADKAFGLLAGSVGACGTVALVFLVMTVWPRDEIRHAFAVRSVVGRNMVRFVPYLEAGVSTAKEVQGAAQPAGAPAP